MTQTVLIVLAVWAAHALLFIPPVLLIGYVGRRADDAALAHHRALLEAGPASELQREERHAALG